MASLVSIQQAVAKDGVWRGKVTPQTAALIYGAKLRPVGSRFEELDRGGVFELRRQGHFQVVPNGLFKDGDILDRHTPGARRLSKLFDHVPVCQAFRRDGFTVLVPFTAPGVRVW